MSVGWTTIVLDSGGDVELEQADEEGLRWTGLSDAGSAEGGLAETLAVCAPDAERAWRAAVVAAIEREVQLGWRRSTLTVARGDGELFHATRRVNRASIRAHGLDPRRMTHVPGIAGSTRPEWPGTLLCDRESASFFASMPDEPVDVWAVDVTGCWLQGAPDADGGGSLHWAITEDPLPPQRLRLVGGF